MTLVAVLAAGPVAPALQRLEGESQARISLTSAGPEPGIRAPAGPAVLPIAAQHQPGGQHRP